MKRVVVECASNRREQLVDVTDKLRRIAKENPGAALMALFSKGATSAVMVQENWDPNICDDILKCLRNLAPQGVWLHDRQDGNGDAHLKAGLIGPSETVPVIDGELGLSRWQNLFFCEFDGPRRERRVVCTVLAGWN